MRERDLQRQLRAVAEWLDGRGEFGDEEPADSEVSPHSLAARPNRRLRFLAVAAAVVAVLAAGVAALQPWGDRDDEVTADQTPSTTSTTVPGTSPTATGSSWTGPGFFELPPSGIAVIEGHELVFHDDDGNELARATSPAIEQLLVHPGLSLAAVRPDDSVEAVLAYRSDAPPDCDSAASAGGVRVALCGGAPQDRQQVVLISPTGDRRVLADAPEGSSAPDGSLQIGHWRSAVPSPDGRWVLATWSGECETRTAFLLSAAGDEPAISVDGRVDLASAVESAGVGWSRDGRAIVQFGPGLCDIALDRPGVYLVEPGSLDRRLVIRQHDLGSEARLWRTVSYGNDAEWIFSSVLEQLGLGGCCGEPSHGGVGLVAGATWQGYEIPVGATPPGSTEMVPFGDRVSSSEPIELDGAPAVAGETDQGPFIAYACGARVWTFGHGAGAGDRPHADAVRSLAAAVLPYLGCTVGERPQTGSSGPGS